MNDDLVTWLRDMADDLSARPELDTTTSTLRAVANFVAVAERQLADADRIKALEAERDALLGVLHEVVAIAPWVTLDQEFMSTEDKSQFWRAVERAEDVVRPALEDDRG